MTGYDVAVIGGGLHGSSAALHLAMIGARAIVLEKDFVGRHASGVNAGGVRRLARDPREIPLAVESLKLWQQIVALVDDDCGFVSHGHVQVAETPEEVEGQQVRVAALTRLGFVHERIVDREELRAVVPQIADHCLGGIFVREDGAAMPYQTTMAFQRKAAALGATFREGIAVTSVARQRRHWLITASDGSSYEADHLVNCTGAWANDICRQLGEPVPLEPIAPMLMITAPMPAFVRPVVSAAGRVLSFKQFANGTVLIGGGLTGHVVTERNRAELDFAKLGVSARTVLDLLPCMRQAKVVRAWAGIEARMPDDIPVIGRSSSVESAYHAFGFSAHGFQLGPIVGRLLAELIVQGASSIDISAFDIRRFIGVDQ